MCRELYWMRLYGFEDTMVVGSHYRHSRDSPHDGDDRASGFKI